MILVIGHEASLTGAPIVLLHYSRWLTEIKKEKLIFLFTLGGPLIADFEKLGDVFILEPCFEPSPLITRIKKRILFNTEKNHKKNIIGRLLLLKPKLIINNTIVNGKVLKYFEGARIKIVSIIHELESVIRIYDKRGMVNDTIRLTDNFIVVSQAVKNNLINNHDIPEEKISVIYECVPNLSNSFKENCNIKEFGREKFIIGGCGNLIFRKGIDVFVRVAYELIYKRNIKDVLFFWVGGNEQSNLFVETNEDIKKLGLNDYVQISGETKSPHAFYEGMNIFLMTSREDPFPLVNLEAAQHGLPIICFDRSGGSPEFVTEDVGFVVPYLDVSAMADKIEILKNDIKLTKQFSANIKEKSKQYTVDIMAIKLYETITPYLINKTE